MAIPSRRDGLRLLCACIAGLLLSTMLQARGAPLQAGMARGLAEEKLSGAVWATVGPDGVVTGAAGLKNAATGAAMREDSIVQVGSVTKLVLAMGVLRLVSTGALGLDTEVARLLPQLRVDNPWHRTDPMRVRHLLDHTAGLENFRFSQVFSLAAHPDLPLGAALERGNAVLTLNRRPGSRYAYSNTGYLLLGMVIEAVTGMRYERYLDTQLLRPLGMKDSSFAFRSQVGPAAEARMAMGHFEEGVTQPAIPVFHRPSDQFTTTAGDMARFARFLLDGGKIDGQPFIAPALLADLAEPTRTEAARAGLRIGHGLALALRDRHGVIGECHPGTSIGFRAMFCLYPEQGKAFFVAMNTDSETARYERFNQMLLDALQLERRRPGAPAPALPPDIAAWEGVYVPAWNAVASLAWVDTVFNPVILRRDGARLQVRALQADPLDLQPAGGMLFQAGGRTVASHVLLTSQDGERFLSNGLHHYRKTPWTAMLALWTSTALGLAGTLYVLGAGGWQLVRGRLRLASPLAPPLACLLALALPAPLFLTQSFLALGDLTPASATLALVTALLPVGIACGLLRALKARTGAGRVDYPGALALAAVLQWLLVLAVWKMIPVVLWR